jgi:hypothetical protein
MSGAAVRKRVSLCADDFGLSEAASASMVVLAGLRAISAASARRSPIARTRDAAQIEHEFRFCRRL